MKKYLSIHCHFYQPPRENPWLEQIEIQDLAYPFHDWNEKINSECYAPNGASRILNDNNKIIKIVNNYLNISFNFGPTLLTWIEKHDPFTYQKILMADQQSIKEHSGHGNALAQGYNHIILPLAELKDQETQVIWGIEDFKSRFNRDPEGMWLPETAVNTEILETLVNHKINFTILSPFQAKRIRKLGSKEWIDVDNSQIDPTRSYLCKLKNGQSIALFFYDANISQAVAFEGLLKDGIQFSNRLLKGYSANRDNVQLLNIATDGETYGHHFKFGEMALSYAIRDLVENHGVIITNYAEFLERVPPEYEVEIHENSSWSCFHGVERWKSDCGCRINQHANWNQRWRKPLRDSLNNLKEQINMIFEKESCDLLSDPWKARNDYIHIILNRSMEQINQFFHFHQKKALSQSEQSNCVKLLELQRHGMLMFTSCGWFFDDISGIETIQILKHACRTIQIAYQFGYDLEKEFIETLEKGKSNIDNLKDAKEIYYKLVKPSQVDLKRVIAHCAIAYLLPTNHSDDTPLIEKKTLYCLTINTRECKKSYYGTTSIAVGWLKVTSNITLESEEAVFAVLHLGHHDLQCKISGLLEISEYQKIQKDLIETFDQHSLTQVIRKLDHYFPGDFYSLKDLFAEERRKLLTQVSAEIFHQFENGYFDLYHKNKRLMEYHLEVDVPFHKEFQKAAQFVLSSKLEKKITEECAIEGKHDYSDDIRKIVDESKKWYINLDLSPSANRISKAIDSKMNKIKKKWSANLLIDILRLISLSQEIKLPITRWIIQNKCYSLYQSPPPIPESEKSQSMKLLKDLSNALGFELS